MDELHQKILERLVRLEAKLDAYAMEDAHRRIEDLEKAVAVLQQSNQQTTEALREIRNGIQDLMKVKNRLMGAFIVMGLGGGGVGAIITKLFA